MNEMFISSAFDILTCLQTGSNVIVVESQAYMFDRFRFLNLVLQSVRNVHCAGASRNKWQIKSLGEHVKMSSVPTRLSQG